MNVLNFAHSVVPFFKGTIRQLAEEGFKKLTLCRVRLGDDPPAGGGEVCNFHYLYFRRVEQEKPLTGFCILRVECNNKKLILIIDA